MVPNLSIALIRKLNYLLFPQSFKDNEPEL